MKLGDLDILYDAVERECKYAVSPARQIWSYFLDLISNCPDVDPETLPIVQELKKENDELKQRIVFWNRDMIAQLTNENQELKQQLSRMAEERHEAIDALDNVARFGDSLCKYCKLSSKCDLNQNEPCMDFEWQGLQEEREENAVD